MTRRSSDRGTALVVAVMATTMMGALAAALVLVTATETAIGERFGLSVEARHAADAASEWATIELGAITDWNEVLRGSRRLALPFASGPEAGPPQDVRRVINRATCGSEAPCAEGDWSRATALRPWGANNPRWQLLASGTLAQLVGTEPDALRLRLVVLIADDPLETDNDPTTDAAQPSDPGHRILVMRSEALGSGGARAVVETTVARRPAEPVDAGAPAPSPSVPGEIGAAKFVATAEVPVSPGSAERQVRVLSWRLIR